MRMRSTYWVAKIFLQGLLLVGISAQAQTSPIKPLKDITSIRVGDVNIAMLDTIINKNNAHPIEYLSFFIPNAGKAATQIPFEINGDYEPSLSIQKGADCVVSTVRVLHNGDNLRVIFASRKGEWAERKPFNFLVFDFTKNNEDAPGTPNIYFKQIKNTNTKSSYCDANVALEKEQILYR